MAHVLLTYDIQESPGIHTRLKNELKTKYGFSDQIYGYNTQRWYNLPNTTLQKENTTTADAVANFVAACQSVGARWEKYITVDFTNYNVANQ